MTEQPSYYAIIPAQIRYDKRLIPRAILLYGEITALCNKTGVCWATDDYFAKLYQVSKTTIQNWLNSLEQFGYIHRQVQYKEGTKHIEKRYIRILEYLPKESLIPIQENFSRGMQENLGSPIQENLRENNTSINNTRVNNTYNIDQSTSKEADKVSLKNRFELIWKEYPKKQGKENAFKAYQKAIKEGITDETIFNGINSYKKQIELQRTELQYVKQGSSFFNQRSYLDEFITSNNKVKYSHQEQEIPPEWAEEFASAGQLNVTDDILLDELPF